MRTWTDEELGELLGVTFRGHESLADPDRARALARTRPRRRWAPAIAAAAVVALAAGAASYAVGREDGSSLGPGTPASSASDPAPTAAGPTYADNRALALAEARRVVGLAPLPDEAVRLDDEPAEWPGGAYGMAPSDPELRQTAWWSVPLPAEQVAHHLGMSRPDGFRSQGTSSSSYGDGPPVEEIDYTLPSPAPLAMSDLYLSVQWVQVDDATLVRADTFTAARSVRSPASLVPDDVDEVEVLLVRDGHRTRRTVRAAEDPATVDALARAVDELPASIRPRQNVGCLDSMGPLPALTLTFRTAADDLTFHVVDWCLGQVEVTRDGERVDPTLDPTGLLDRVEQLVR